MTSYALLASTCVRYTGGEEVSGRRRGLCEAPSRGRVCLIYSSPRAKGR